MPIQLKHIDFSLSAFIIYLSENHAISEYSEISFYNFLALIFLRRLHTIFHYLLPGPAKGQLFSRSPVVPALDIAYPQYGALRQTPSCPPLATEPFPQAQPFRRQWWRQQRSASRVPLWNPRRHHLLRLGLAVLVVTGCAYRSAWLASNGMVLTGIDRFRQISSSNTASYNRRADPKEEGSRKPRRRKCPTTNSDYRRTALGYQSANN